MDDTFSDALKMVETDFSDDQSGERDPYVILHSMMAYFLNVSRIEDSLSKIASTSICKDGNIDKLAAVMKNRLFDSDDVMAMMVQRMQHQFYKVVSQDF